MLDAPHIVLLHDQATARWHQASFSEPEHITAWDALILDQHRANFDLWHHEDAARDPDASDHDITIHKHDIDTLNQRRNDLAEQIDLLLVAEAPPQNEATPLHSETPGMMIDRLSILALKRFHTEEETRRAGASPAHHERNRARLAVLDSQRSDLAGCLDALWQDALSGRRRFKLYRQLKMYNDPELNPVLYSKAPAETFRSGES
jgi:cell division protein FtsB